jgi:hypothetical protein
MLMDHRSNTGSWTVKDICCVRAVASTTFGTVQVISHEKGKPDKVVMANTIVIT